MVNAEIGHLEWARVQTQLSLLQTSPLRKIVFMFSSEWIRALLQTL